MTRDELYFKMKEQNVLGRRYFYPLISEFYNHTADLKAQTGESVRGAQDGRQRNLFANAPCA